MPGSVTVSRLPLDTAREIVRRVWSSIVASQRPAHPHHLKPLWTTFLFRNSNETAGCFRSPQTLYKSRETVKKLFLSPASVKRIAIRLLEPREKMTYTSERKAALGQQWHVLKRRQISSAQRNHKHQYQKTTKTISIQDTVVPPKDLMWSRN